VVPSVIPQLVANTGVRALRAAIAEPDRYVVEPKVDGVRGLVVSVQTGRLRRATGAANGVTGSAATGSRAACGGWLTGCRSCGTAQSSTAS
jgi:hypothetical protein